ncbi:MAG: D-alanine--D-alanine ligase family protein [Saccharofermentanales bacterium]
MKKNICVLFGGKSSEFYVSCNSARTIITNIPTEKYNVIPVGITQEGDWYYYEDSIDLLPEAKWLDSEKKYPAAFLTNAKFPGLTVFRGEKTEQIAVDAVFPVLHGKNGEDGTVQGLLDMLEIPYVGCGLLSSAISMDKSYTKMAVNTLAIKQAPYVLLTSKQTAEKRIANMDKAEKELGYPMFVKPCRAGSSCGVSKAKDRAGLEKAIEEALKFDSKVLVEKAIVGRELECAVLDAEELVPSRVGEIVVTAEFYSYDAKYADATSRTDTDPDLPDGVVERIQDAACRIFRMLDCRSLSRVDFFLEESTGDVVFNEINTLPGFTNISMYPMLMGKVGYPLPELVDKLIETAFMV